MKFALVRNLTWVLEEVVNASFDVGILLVPIVLFVWHPVFVQQGFDQEESQFGVIGLVLVPKVEYLLDEAHERLCVVGLAQPRSRNTVFEVLGVLELLSPDLWGSWAAEVDDEGQCAVQHVYHEVAKRDEVVSAAEGPEIERVYRRKDEVALEQLLVFLLHVLALWVKVLFGDAEVDQVDVVQLLIVAVTDENVVGLEVVEQVATLMNGLDLLQNLDANLHGALLGKGLAPDREVVLESFPEPLLHYIGPNLRLILLVQGESGALNFGHETGVLDDDSALAVRLGEVALFRLAMDLLEDLVLLVVHLVLLSELDDNWGGTTTDHVCNVHTVVDLAERTLGEFVLDNEVADSSIAEKEHRVHFAVLSIELL